MYLQSRLKSEQSTTLSTIKEFLINLGKAHSLLSEVVKPVSLVLVMPATNATSKIMNLDLECLGSFVKTMIIFL